jgi:hypothetical protein
MMDFERSIFSATALAFLSKEALDNFASGSEDDRRTIFQDRDLLHPCQ